MSTEPMGPHSKFSESARAHPRFGQEYRSDRNGTGGCRIVEGMARRSSLFHDAKGSLEDLFEVAESGVVVAEASANDLVGFFPAIGVGNFTATIGGPRSLLVGEEIMAQAVEHGGGNVGNICPGTIGGVLPENADDLVIGFVLIEHPEAADGDAIDKNIAMLDGTISQDADIERIAVSFERATGLFRREGCDGFATKGLWNETVEGRANVRIFLRPVDFEVAGDLFDFVFQRVGGHNFNEALHDVRHMIAGRNPVPGMGLK